MDTPADTTTWHPSRWRASILGHVWTLLPHLRSRIAPARAPASVPYALTVDDPRLGAVQLTGALRTRHGANTIAILVHGLGGNADAGYCLDAAGAVDRAGWACLRIHLRGADGRGADLYHAGLTSDLAAIVASPQVQEFERVIVIGFSLGGHLALRYGLDPDPRVVAVTAICSPLDLHLSARAIDRRRATLYRRHVLSELKSAYRPVARRAPRAHTPVATVDALTKLRAWDAQVVVPRFGFDSAPDYYERAGVGPHLSRLRVPSLYVGAPLDPMVPAFTVEPALAAAGPALQVRWVERAGHVGFAERTMLDRIVGWTHERSTQ